MAAFDVTTRPGNLSLKPGSTGTIMVVVSNRLGRPIMGLVEGLLTPASAARWLVLPPDLQRRYEADPAATVNYEFKVAVPKDAPAQPVQFKASVRDVLSPDDTRVEGQTVAINVTPDAVTPTTGKKKLPWWVWLIAGLVVVAVAIGIILAVKKEGNDCKKGFVWRLANEEDHVCVSPNTYKETLEENKLADERRSPTGGAYGPNTCLQGFVWREAYPGDVVCVTGSSRARAGEDNAQAAERKKP